MASRVNEDKTTVKDDEAILSIFPSDPLYQWLYYKGKVPQGEREENLLRSIFMDGMDYAHDWNMVGEKMLEKLGIRVDSFSDIDRAKKDLSVILTSPFLSLRLGKRKEVNAFIMAMAEVEKASSLIRPYIMSILSEYDERVFSLPFEALDKVAKGEYSRKEKALVRSLSKLRKDKGRLNRRGLEKIAKALVKVKKAVKVFSSIEGKVPYKGEGYKGIDTDWKTYAEEIDLYRSLVSHMERNVFLSSSVEEIRSEAKMLNRRIDEMEKRYSGTLSSLSSCFDSTLFTLSFGAMEKKLSSCLDSFSLLKRWTEVRDRIEVVEEEKTEESQKEVVKVEEKKEERGEEEELFPLLEKVDLGEKLKELGISDLSSPLLPEALCHIIKKEGPMTERDAARRFALALGEGLTDDFLSRFIEAISSQGIEIGKNGFLYLRGEEILFHRSLERRDFSHVSPEELSDGMEKILLRYGRMKKKDLYGLLGSFSAMSMVLSVRYGELDRILFSLENVVLEGEYVYIGDKK